jgi:hypothetical protein
MTLSPNTNGFIDLPSNCIKIDTISVLRDYTTDIVERNRKLYDRVTNSFVFTKDIDVDMVILLPFDGIPEVARRYITLRAGRKYQENIIGSPTLSKLQADEEGSALIALKEAEAGAGDFNIFDHYDTYRHLDRYISTASSTLI